MEITLSAAEVRVLGSLVEKEATTPDTYPLTLNALLTACNQKSNREPVLSLQLEELVEALDALTEKTLISLYQSGHNRAPKYRHKLRHRAFDEFNFSGPQLAVLCVLFLRGPQTPGEIRTRSTRLHEFANPEAVVTVLAELRDNEHGPYVIALARQPGRKESRYAHLFSGEVDPGAEPTSGSGMSRRELETQIAELSERLQALEQRFESFTSQFE